MAILISLSGCQREKRYFVISKIQSAAKLATTETQIDKIVVGGKERRIAGLVKINEAHFVAYTQATVKTGIDLTKLSVDDIKIDHKQISITLPAIEVLDFIYPFDKFKINRSISKNAFLNRIDIVDYEKFYRMAELDIRENLQYTGIIEETEKKTRLLMTGLLKNLGYEEIYVKFKPVEELFKPLNLEGD